MNGHFYSEREGELIAHCPGCRGVVLKETMSGADTPGSFSIRLRCPHCEDCVEVVFRDNKPSFIQKVEHRTNQTT